MNIFTKTLVLICSVGLLAVGASTAHAQTGAPVTPAPTSSSTPATAVTVATVNIYNARIVTQSDNTVTLSFDLSNRENIQPDIQYAVDLIQQGVNGQSIIDEHVYAEVVSLGENQTVSRQIDYTAPSYLSGEYQIWLVAKNHNGMTLALANPGKVTLSGTDRYVRIDPLSCYLQVGSESRGTRYSPDQGVDVNAGETLLATCSATNHASTALTVTPHLETYLRSTFGKPVQTAAQPQDMLTFRPEGEQVIHLTIPKPETPQAYDAMLTLQDQDGQTLSNKIVFHYVVRGTSATIQNARLDKDAYVKGDVALVSFFWTPAADNFPGSRLGATQEGSTTVAITIHGSQGQTCGTFSQVLDARATTPTLAVPITADCLDPNVAISINDGHGNTLDQTTFDITSSQNRHASTTPWNPIAIGLIIVGLIIGGVALILKRRAAAAPVLLALIAAGGFFLVGVPQAKADTFVLSAGSASNTYVVNINKSTYSPGETITATGQGTWSWCSNTYGNIALKATINNATKQLFNYSKNLNIDLSYAAQTVVPYLYSNYYSNGDNGYYLQLPGGCPSDGGVPGVGVGGAFVNSCERGMIQVCTSAQPIHSWMYGNTSACTAGAPAICTTDPTQSCRNNWWSRCTPSCSSFKTIESYYQSIGYDFCSYGVSYNDSYTNICYQYTSATRNQLSQAQAEGYTCYSNWWNSTSAKYCVLGWGVGSASAAAPMAGGQYTASFSGCMGFENGCPSSAYSVGANIPYTVYTPTCTLPWGGTLQSGSSVTAYQSSSVMAPATCTAQTRTCNNGTLSGSYQYQSCIVRASATLTAQPTTITAGTSVTLSWNSYKTQSCVLDHGVVTGGKTSGSVSVTPVTTTTYTLSCTPTDGSAAVTSSATVTVNSSGLACTQTGGNFTATPGKDPYRWTVDGVSSSVTTNSVPIPTTGGSHSASVSAGGSVANCPLITVASQSQGQGNGGTGGGSGSTDGCVIQPTGTLTASPNRVSSVATPIKLSWSVQGYNTLDSFVKTGKCEIDKNGKMLINLKDASVDSCNASGTYTDVAGVSNQTVYTLYCQGVGSTLGSFIVNVMPKFNEF